MNTVAHELEQRLRQLRAGAAVNRPGDLAWPLYEELLSDFERAAAGARQRLLGTALAWTEEDRGWARWLHRMCDGLALAGHGISGDLIAARGAGDELTRRAMAHTVACMGETVKYEAVVNPKGAHDYAKLHGLMRVAMAADRHRERMVLAYDGANAECTLESLYFRALLLARLGSGLLNLKQLEILDAWMWRWMPVLAGVATPPAGAALRVDLESAEGLHRGRRAVDGPSLYLPQGPIAAAYRAIIAELHRGQLVPAHGRTAGFRLEEHVAVLDVIRRALKDGRQERVVRAERAPADGTVEILVGLGEIMARAFSDAPPSVAPITLVTAGGVAAAPRRVSDRQVALDDIYDAPRRMVRLVNTSATGIGLDGADVDCGGLAAGDLVALRMAPGGPLTLGRLVRAVPSKTPGRVVMGVRRLASAPRLAHLSREEDAAANDEAAIFVAGTDPSGRHDAYLVSERAFQRRGTAALYTQAADTAFTLRFNRVRERGRGWVLAGYEVVAARPVHEFLVA